jgi:hypothetical protein
MAALKAKKDFRKLMRSYKLPSVLKQEEDYEKFYDSETPELEKQADANFQNAREAIFYKEDVDFMRFHKRTTKNVHEALQDLIDSSK